jgi:hypothetical protein
MRESKFADNVLGDVLDIPLWGARAISKQINRSERQTYFLLEEGHLPARKIGGTWTSTPRALRAHFCIEAA